MKTAIIRKDHQLEEYLLSERDCLTFFVHNEGLGKVGFYLLEICTENLCQSIDLLTFTTFFPYQLIYVMEKLADFVLLFDTFLLFVERKQLTFEDYLKDVTLIEIFCLFFRLQSFSQQAEKSSLLQLVCIADDFLRLL